MRTEPRGKITSSFKKKSAYPRYDCLSMNLQDATEWVLSTEGLIT